jgi:hypothetical protein
MYSQTAVAHKEYFNRVLSLFIPFCVKDYTHQSRTIVGKRTNKSYSSISFTTMQLPCFNEYRNLFYNLNVKICASPLPARPASGSGIGDGGRRKYI